jgi:hypothetical protein
MMGKLSRKEDGGVLLEDLPAVVLGGEAGGVTFGEGGVGVGEVEVGEFEAGGDGGLVVDGAFDFEVACGGGDGDGVGGEGEGLAGGDEGAVADAAGFLEDDEGVGEIFGVADEPGGGLDGGFEHHDAGEDGEAGEVVGEVFLGHGDVLGHDDPLAGLEGEKLIDEDEFQGLGLGGLGGGRGCASLG